MVHLRDLRLLDGPIRRLTTVLDVLAVDRRGGLRNDLTLPQFITTIVIYPFEVESMADDQ